MQHVSFASFLISIAFGSSLVLISGLCCVTVGDLNDYELRVLQKTTSGGRMCCLDTPTLTDAQPQHTLRQTLEGEGSERETMDLRDIWREHHKRTQSGEMCGLVQEPISQFS